MIHAGTAIQLAWSYERPFLPLLIEPIDFPEQAEY
jgi:hypothetical protein